MKAKAAWAGIQGKGFAVVAREVKKLSNHSALAAQEIADIVKNSSMEVENGNAIVKETLDSFNEIIESITILIETTEAIASANHGQLNMIKNMTMGIGSASTQDVELNEELLDKLKSINT